jgi:hypothetical protein
MAFLQSTYSENMPIGSNGRRVNMEEWNTITRTYGGASTIGFGKPVIADGDHGCLPAGADTLSAAGAAVAGNTGANTITASPAVAAGTPLGVYTLTAVTAGAAAIWLMANPAGVELGEVTTAVAATIAGIGPFTIADPGTDAAVGDQMTITVSSDAEGFLGITEADVGLGHATNPDLFQQDDNVPIMDMGVIWVIAGGTVTRGQKAYFNIAAGKYTATTTDYPIKNGEFDSGAVLNGLVKVRLRRVP